MLLELPSADACRIFVRNMDLLVGECHFHDQHPGEHLLQCSQDRVDHVCNRWTMNEPQCVTHLKIGPSRVCAEVVQVLQDTIRMAHVIEDGDTRFTDPALACDAFGHISVPNNFATCSADVAHPLTRAVIEWARDNFTDCKLNTKPPTANPTATSGCNPPLIMNVSAIIQGSITCGLHISGSNRGATSLIGGSSGDHAYTFTIGGAQTKTVTFETCNSGFDTVLHIFRDNVLIRRCDDCQYDPRLPCTSLREQLQVDLEPGTYAIIVDGFGDREGDYVLGMTGNCGSGSVTRSPATAGPTTPPSCAVEDDHPRQTLTVSGY